MQRTLKLIVLCLLMVGCAGPRALGDGPGSERYSPPPEAIVLRVEVLATEFTDLYPDCAEPDECVPFYFWYKYRARVKEVVSGVQSLLRVPFEADRLVSRRMDGGPAEIKALRGAAGRRGEGGLPR